VLWTRLNDPLRIPAHWTEIIRPGQYAVFVYDIRTHVTRDASVALCDDLAEAVAFAGSVVAAHPELCCEVYDHEGKSNEPIQVIYAPSVEGRCQGRPVARRATVWGSVILLGTVVLLGVDIRHGLAWIWGYVIGLKLLVIGVSLLVRGLAGLYEHREGRSAAAPTPHRR